MATQSLFSPSHTPHSASSTLKILRALASAEQQQCNVARNSLEETTDKLRAAARTVHNLLNSLPPPVVLKSLPPPYAPLVARLRLPSILGEAPEPSVPPARLRIFLTAYGSLVTVLRRQPIALAEAVQRSGASAATAVRLLLNFVWGHAWRVDEADTLIRAAAHLVHLSTLTHGVAKALLPGSLAERLCCTLLRTLPGGAAWLQACLAPPLNALAAATDDETLLLAGDPAALGQRCEAILVSVLEHARAAPAGLCALGRHLLRRTSADGSRSDATDAANFDGDALVAMGSAWITYTEVLVGLLIAPAVACPEAYGVLLPAPLSTGARANLALVAHALTRAVTPDAPQNRADDVEAVAEAAGEGVAPARKYNERLARARTANVGAGKTPSQLLKVGSSGDVAGAAATGPPMTLQAKLVDSLRQVELGATGELAKRCAVRIVLGGDAPPATADTPSATAYSGGDDDALAQAHAEATVLLAAAAETDAASRGYPSLAADAGNGEALRALPPPLECEIPLAMLRALHSICDAQRTALVARASDEPMLGTILDTLEPATLVLAEVGIVWGDEVVALEIGESATIEFARREAERAAEMAAEKAAAEAEGAPGAGGGGRLTVGSNGPRSATKPEVTMAGVPARAQELMRRLQYKLAVLLNRLPLASISDANIRDAMSIADDARGAPAGVALSEHAVGAPAYTSASPPPPGANTLAVSDDGAVQGDRHAWRVLVAALRHENAQAVAAGNDSLNAQLREVLVEVDSLIIAAAADEGRSGEGAARVETWVDCLWRGVEAQIVRHRGKTGAARDEWTAMAMMRELASTSLTALTEYARRLRLARCLALLPPLLEKDALVFEHARAAAADAAPAQTWWADLDESDQLVALTAIARWRRGPAFSADDATPSPSSRRLDGVSTATILDDADDILDSIHTGMSPGSHAAPSPALSAVQGAARVLLRDADAGMHRLRVPPSVRTWLRACVPAGKELLRRACATQDGVHSARLLGELWETVRSGLQADGIDRYGVGSPPLAHGESGEGDDGSDEPVDGGSWAWLLVRCRPAAAGGELLPCLPAALLAVQAENQKASAPLSSARAGVLLALDAASLVVDAAASAAPPTPSTTNGLPSAATTASSQTIAASSAAATPPPQPAASQRRVEIRTAVSVRAAGTTRLRVDLRITSDAPPAPPPLSLSATLHAPLATGARWASFWRVGLARARRDACLLVEEDEAMDATASRLRAAGVRLHVQQLACWVQADALRALAHGVSVRGVAEGAIDAHTEGGLSVPFEESKHSTPREHSEACAALLRELRDSPAKLALGLRRSELLDERCPVADVEVATQFLLCALYANRAHPHDERALIGLFVAIAEEGANAAGGGGGAECADGDGKPLVVDSSVTVASLQDGGGNGSGSGGGSGGGSLMEGGTSAGGSGSGSAGGSGDAGGSGAGGPGGGGVRRSGGAGSSAEGAALSTDAPQAEETPSAKTPAESLLRGGLLSALVTAYMRMIPAGAAWLQAALGAQLVAIAEASDQGLRLLTDPMDACARAYPPPRTYPPSTLPPSQLGASIRHTRPNLFCTSP